MGSFKMASLLDVIMQELEAGFTVQDHETLDAMCIQPTESNSGREAVNSDNTTHVQQVHSVNFIEAQKSNKKLPQPSMESMNDKNLGSDMDLKMLWKDEINSVEPVPWGRSHLVKFEECSAIAKFAGGGSEDVPSIISSKSVERGGRGLWEVRFDKKGSGLVKIGLVRIYDKIEPFSTGVTLGMNWNDRRCVGLAFYLDSEGGTYDGNKPLTDGSKGFSSGDILTVEVRDGEANFWINGILIVQRLCITAWPVHLGILLVFKGDRATLLREEVIDSRSYPAWALAREKEKEAHLSARQTPEGRKYKLSQAIPSGTDEPASRMTEYKLQQQETIAESSPNTFQAKQQQTKATGGGGVLLGYKELVVEESDNDLLQAPAQSPRSIAQWEHVCNDIEQDDLCPSIAADFSDDPPLVEKDQSERQPTSGTHCLQWVPTSDLPCDDETNRRPHTCASAQGKQNLIPTAISTPRTGEDDDFSSGSFSCDVLVEDLQAEESYPEAHIPKQSSQNNASVVKEPRLQPLKSMSSRSAERTGISFSTRSNGSHQNGKGRTGQTSGQEDLKSAHSLPVAGPISAKGDSRQSESPNVSAVDRVRMRPLQNETSHGNPESHQTGHQVADRANVLPVSDNSKAQRNARKEELVPLQNANGSSFQKNGGNNDAKSASKAHETANENVTQILQLHAVPAEEKEHQLDLRAGETPDVSNGFVSHISNAIEVVQKIDPESAAPIPTYHAIEPRVDSPQPAISSPMTASRPRCKESISTLAREQKREGRCAPNCCSVQ